MHGARFFGSKSLVLAAPYSIDKPLARGLASAFAPTGCARGWPSCTWGKLRAFSKDKIIRILEHN